MIARMQVNPQSEDDLRALAADYRRYLASVVLFHLAAADAVGLGATDYQASSILDLGFSLVSISARYDDWPYLQGMDSVVDFDLFDEVGVNRDPFGPDSYRDPGVYTFGTGERYSFGENFPYQPGSPIGFEVSVTPVDSEGDLLHDEGLDGSGSGTIR